MGKVEVRPLGVQIADYLRTLKIIGIRRYIPYFISSIGAHIAHLYNYGFEELSSTFWTQSGGNFDCRLHLLLVGPPGYGKNFLINNFISEEIGLAHGMVPTVFIGKVTDKKFFGGYSDKGTWSPGVAEEYQNGIVGVREFNSVLAMGQTEHSPLILENMLEALYGGDVNVGIGEHSLRNYRTYFTLWAGIQSERFAVPAGFPRRVLLLNLAPTQSDVKAYANAYLEGRNISPDYQAIRRIREQFLILHREFGTYINAIKFSNEYTRLLRDELKLAHTEMEIIDKLSAGWTIMYKYRGEGTLMIYPEKPLKTLILQYIDMKHRILHGVTSSQILQLIQDEPISTTEFKRLATKLGIEYKKTSETLDELAGKQVITYETHRDEATNRTSTYLVKGPNWSPAFITEE